jgi:hypothetical protein
MWGPGIELAINPCDPAGFKNGTTSVRALVSCDAGVAHSNAINAATSIT